MKDNVDFYGKKLDQHIAKLESVAGDLDYLHMCITTEIEGLEELRGEVGERLEKLAFSIDLNKRKE